MFIFIFKTKSLEIIIKFIDNSQNIWPKISENVINI
jgi:hypothetical protein